MSDETFDTEALMRDILEVLKKHETPVQRVTINLSFLMKDFDKIYPDFMYTNNEGFNHWEHMVDNIYSTVQIGPQYVFNDFVS